MTVRDLEHLLLPLRATVRDAMARIDANRTGIALVVDDERKLLGTVTDGDLRRAMLAGIELDTAVVELLERQRALHEGRPVPLTAPADASNAELVVLMRRFEVRQVPIVDEQGRVDGLALLDELIDVEGPPLRAVVMAGGFGTRLAELTHEIPKPMLPVGDRPLLERIIEQLRDAGIRSVNLTTHYRADAIVGHFGDGSEFGVRIEYVPEERPLGTAGALGSLVADEPVLVMNGDILTRIDFRALRSFHEEHRADMTVAVRPYEVRVPFGVVEVEGERVARLSEKPAVRGLVNAGIYLVGPPVIALVHAGEVLDMPVLIERAVAAGRNVVAFPMREYWLDIGRVEDYERATVDVESL